MNNFKLLPSYEEFINKHEGETACVVGAGTSLFEADLDFIHNSVVFSVNSSILLMPWESGSSDKRYWVSNDAGVTKWTYWEKVMSSKCNKIIRNSWEKNYNGFDLTDFYKFCPRPTSEDIINENDIGLAYCSSVPSSVDLAIQMGCKRIFIFGADQYMVNNKSHFWEYWPIKDRPRRGFILNPDNYNTQNYAFGFNIKAYKALKKFAGFKDCKIYNCNPNSRVKHFPYITIDDARNMI